MCLLTAYRKGAMPNKAELLQGARTNDDGHGFAMIVGHGKDRRIITHWGMDGPETVRLFCVLRELHPEGEAMFHSRWTTHGATGIPNCHPFKVAGYHETWLGHNGVLPSEVQPGKKDTRSDTAILAEDYLSGYKGFSLFDASVLAKLGSWIGRGNKLAILTLDPHADRSLYIVNEHLGTWAGDTWYSNDGYLPYWDRYPSRPLGEGWSYTVGGQTRTYASGWTDDGEFTGSGGVRYRKDPDSNIWRPVDEETGAGVEDCPLCGTRAPYSDASFCRSCHTCFVCLEDLIEECTCARGKTQGAYWSNGEDWIRADTVKRQVAKWAAQADTAAVAETSGTPDADAESTPDAIQRHVDRIIAEHVPARDLTPGPGSSLVPFSDQAPSK